jgi:hypothetical protein
MGEEWGVWTAWARRILGGWGWVQGDWWFLRWDERLASEARRAQREEGKIVVCSGELRVGCCVVVIEMRAAGDFTTEAIEGTEKRRDVEVGA